MDDELNLLNVADYAEEIEDVKGETLDQKASQQLNKLKEDLKEKEVVGPLISLSKTLDQAKALMVFIDAVMQKTSRSTISLTAARGRGKSAAVGISVAAAIALGFSNIFVTAPSP